MKMFDYAQMDKHNKSVFAPASIFVHVFVQEDKCVGVTVALNSGTSEYF